MPPSTPLTLVGGRLRRTPGSVADAVAAARAALPGWSGTPADERGRLLHEVAELLDALDPAAADRLLWYAGWTDKIAGLVGAVHPVAAPYASWSTPHPVGVVGVLAPGSVLELVDALGAVLAVGATAVVVGPADLASVTELLATSELPPGAANALTGDVAVLGPELARAGVDGLDLAAPDPTRPDLARDAAERGVRVLRPGPGDRGLARLRAWSEVTTTWHSAGR